MNTRDVVTTERACVLACRLAIHDKRPEQDGRSLLQQVAFGLMIQIWTQAVAVTVRLGYARLPDTFQGKPKLCGGHTPSSWR